MSLLADLVREQTVKRFLSTLQEKKFVIAKRCKKFGKVKFIAVDNRELDNLVKEFLEN